MRLFQEQSFKVKIKSTAVKLTCFTFFQPIIAQSNFKNFTPTTFKKDSTTQTLIEDMIRSTCNNKVIKKFIDKPLLNQIIDFLNVNPFSVKHGTFLFRSIIQNDKFQILNGAGWFNVRPSQEQIKYENGWMPFYSPNLIIATYFYPFNHRNTSLTIFTGFNSFESFHFSIAFFYTTSRLPCISSTKYFLQESLIFT